MNSNLLIPNNALNKAYQNTKIIRAEMDNFKTQMIRLIDAIDKKETEEFHKNLVISFLKKTFYDNNNFVNTKGRNDLVIHNGKDAKSSVGVIIEAKSPINKTEMITVNELNGKALQELVLYYLRERITNKNTDLKQLVVTNIYEWFIFDTHIFEKLFAENKKLVKDFNDFEEKRTSGKTTDYFYKEIAKPYIETIKNDLVFAHFDIRKYEIPLRNEDIEDDKLLVALFKIFSPQHFLKLPFANDNNSLDRDFYEELLHIIGLTEVKDGGKKIIVRQEPKNRNAGSLLENAITQLESLDKISRIKNPKNYGDTKDEILFGVGLELCITWINRILFLKLLEAQIITYQKNDKSFSFLNSNLIKDYDKLNTLFFQVLAKLPEDRNASVATIFGNVPYLNSSLFEPTELEHETLFISGLEDDTVLNLLPTTVIKDNLKKKTGNLNALEYLFSFLDAYDFATDATEKFKADDKKLINAAVLGLIFEKINGYKDGSFFTPSFITMYMCRETIRRAVVQKFNDTKGWECADFVDLYNNIKDTKEANAIINKLKICDPAVGSGHFLVSALNEIIAIKHELGVLMDKDGKRLRNYDIEIVNDELIISEGGEILQYNPKSEESQRVQEALFHEKRTIIESCLFGVDINPNSVKICQLRLWIELLKNAYYHFGTTNLETFPNIDINIKCGNSLISRFALDSDLTKALKNSKYNIDTYKIAVTTYQNSTDKAEKREMQAIIEAVKANFTTEIATNDPKKLKLEKIKGELFNKTNQTGMFELGKKEMEVWNKQINLLAAEIAVLEIEIEDIKTNRIYDRAFEWRFEFPQVLNDDADFMGFDVVVGNPPYVYRNSNNEIFKEFYKKNYIAVSGNFDLYKFFIELSFKLMRKNYFNSFITNSSFILQNSFLLTREFILKNNSVVELVQLGPNVFDEATVDSAIYIVQKKIDNENFTKIKVPDLAKNINNSDYKLVKQSRFLQNYGFVFDYLVNDKELLIIDKLFNNFPIIDTKYDFGVGINTGYIKNDLTSNIKLNDNYFPMVLGTGISGKFGKINTTGFIMYDKEFVKSKGKLGRSLPEKKYFDCPKILVIRTRNISIKQRIVATIDYEKFYNLNRLSNIISIDGNSIEGLLGVLNSKLFNWIYSIKFLDYEIKPIYLRNSPLCDSNNKSLINKVTKILSLKKANPQADTLVLEQEIDAMVYKLYGLTDNEIKIVEGR